MIFNNMFKIGYSENSNRSVAKDIAKVKTNIIRDDGNKMIVKVTNEEDAKGFLSIVTDYQIDIKWISFMQGETSIKLPSIDEHVKLYNGGKVFYLYQDSKALSIPADTTIELEIKYTSYEVERRYPHVVIGKDRNFMEDPLKLKVNTIHDYTTGAINELTEKFKFNPYGGYLDAVVWQELPATAQIGDYIEFGPPYNHHDFNRRASFHIVSDIKINGSDETYETYGRIFGCTMTEDGWHVRVISSLA